MAAKKRVKAGGAGKAGARGKARKAKARPAKAPSRRGAKPSAELHEVSTTIQLSVVREFRRVLKEHGISGDIASFQLESTATATARVALGCPPGEIRRLVAIRLPNGTLEVKPACVPVRPVLV
jgi:hypothetical protein